MNATELQDIMKALTAISKKDISKMGVRFYLGINEAGKQTLVIVTVDENGNNVAHYKDEQGQLQSAIFDFTTPSPPFGGQDSNF
jgi:Ethanolamine utilization protein EutJ (predicted chaperonin)